MVDTIRPEDMETLAFASYFFPERFAHSFAKMHVEWVKHFDCPRLCIEAPAFFAKSTFFSFLKPIKDTIFDKKEVAMLSDTGTKAIHFLGWIKSEHEHNERLQAALKGSYVGNKWTEDEITLKNGSILYAKGKHYQFKGWHPHIIICDDLQTEDSATPEQFEKDWSWLRRTVFSRQSRQIIIIGTRNHPLSIIARIIDDKTGEFADWTKLSFKALDENGESVWRSKHPKEEIMKLKKMMGTYAFEAELMNNPTAGMEQEALRAYIKYYDNMPNPPYISLCAIDPAVSDDKGKPSSYTAICILYIPLRGEERGRIYVRHIERQKLTPLQQAKWLLNLHKIHNFNNIGIEAVAYQKALRDMVIDEAMRQMIYLEGVTPITVHRNKIDRLKAVSHLIENGIVLFHPSQAEFIETELLVPNITSNDRLDAFVHALGLAKDYIRGQEININSTESVETEPVTDETGYIIGYEPKVSREERAFYH